MFNFLNSDIIISHRLNLSIPKFRKIKLRYCKIKLLLLYYMQWKESDCMKASISSRIRKAMDIRNMKAVDICEKTGIPKSSISMYLSGKVEPKSDRLYLIAKCLDVAESWLLGYDVPMERTQAQKNNDALSDIVVMLRTDEEFFSIVEKISKMDPEKRKSLNALLD